MKFLLASRKIVSRITGVFSSITYVGYALIILITTLDVILRYVIDKPILGAYEMAQYLLLISVFASFGYCQSLRGHIHVTMFIQMMPHRLAFCFYTVTGLMSSAVMLFVSYAASQQAIYAFEKGYTSDVLHFPAYPFIWVECVGMAIFALAILVDVMYSAVAVFNRELREKLAEEWF